MKPKYILFAAVDTNYRIANYCKFINEQLATQLVAESFSKYILPASHYKTSYTHTCLMYEWSAVRTYIYCASFFIYSLFKYDIFHFIAGETILTRKLRKLELSIYKLLGKRVIMEFVGADIRSLHYTDWKRKNIINYLHGEKNNNYSDDFQLQLIKDARNYATTILVSTPDLLDIIPEAIYAPVLLNKLELPVTENKSASKIKILYSPSSHRTKGSDYIHNALQNVLIINNNEIELILPSQTIKNNNAYALTRYELLNQMNAAHIVIDQMIIGWYGLKTVEALALGCEVICYIDESYEHHLFSNCPIHNANVIDLETVLQNVINEIKNRNMQSNSYGLKWVDKHHTITNNNSLLVHAWLN